MIRSLILLAMLAACGSSHVTPANSQKPATGGEGAVCAVGKRHKGEGSAVECAPGLNCCYPCGIDGCDSVCQVGECRDDIP